MPEVASALSPLVRRIVCNNPGMMTGPGTNTYLVGVDEIASSTPAPTTPPTSTPSPGAAATRIRWIVCTHTHPGPLARRRGPQGAHRRRGPGLRLAATAWCRPQRWPTATASRRTEFRLSAVHTPGHASNHLCYLLEEERLLFSGDHIMGESTVVISPPDGDMAAYLDVARTAACPAPAAAQPSPRPTAT